MSRNVDFQKTLREIKALTVVEGEHKARLRARLLSELGAKEKPMFTKMRLVLAASMVCLAVLAGALVVSFQTPKALAATMEALNKAGSMVCTVVTKTEHDGESKVLNATIYWSGDVTRVDFGGKGQAVHQTLWFETGKTTTIDYADPAQPVATVVLNAGDHLNNSARITSAHALIQILGRSGKVTVVDQKEEGGRKLSVLHLDQWNGFRQDVRLAVDSDTGLPVSVTQTFEGGIARQDFQWNVAIDPELTRVSLPDGVTPKVIDANTQAPPLRIVPGVGIGPVQLGMTSEEVRQVLGNPDKTQFRGDGSVEGMSYAQSLGIGVTFGSDENERNYVVAVSGSLGRYVSNRYRDFAGTTPEGIGLGATAEEIVAAYGKTDNHTIARDGEEIIVYEQPSFEFRLSADPRYGWPDDTRRTRVILVTKYPTPKQASFRDADAPQTEDERKASAAIRSQCGNNLKQLVMACTEYANQHAGNFPDRLSDLYPDYVNGLGVFSCPGSGKQISNSKAINEESSYGIEPGRKTSSSQDLILLYEKANHSPGPSGRHECFVSGKVLFAGN